MEKLPYSQIVMWKNVYSKDAMAKILDTREDNLEPSLERVLSLKNRRKGSKSYSIPRPLLEVIITCVKFLVITKQNGAVSCEGQACSLTTFLQQDHHHTHVLTRTHKHHPPDSSMTSHATRRPKLGRNFLVTTFAHCSFCPSRGCE